MDLNIERCDCIIKSQFIHRACWIFIFQLICDPLSDLSTNLLVGQQINIIFHSFNGLVWGKFCRTISFSTYQTRGFLQIFRNKLWDVRILIFSLRSRGWFSTLNHGSSWTNRAELQKGTATQKLCAQSVKETTLSTIGWSGWDIIYIFLFNLFDARDLCFSRFLDFTCLFCFNTFSLNPRNILEPKPRWNTAWKLQNMTKLLWHAGRFSCHETNVIPWRSCAMENCTLLRQWWGIISDSE